MCCAESKMMQVSGVWITLILAVTFSTTVNAADSKNISYLDLLNRFKSDLVYRGPAPQDYDAESPPTGVRPILYKSGDFLLKAWFWVPDTKTTGQSPLLFIFMADLHLALLTTRILSHCEMPVLR